MYHETFKLRSMITLNQCLQDNRLIRFFLHLVNDIDVKPRGISKGPFYYIIGPKILGNLGDLGQLLVYFRIWAKAASFGQKVKN